MVSQSYLHCNVLKSFKDKFNFFLLPGCDPKVGGKSNLLHLGQKLCWQANPLDSRQQGHLHLCLQGQLAPERPEGRAGGGRPEHRVPHSALAPRDCRLQSLLHCALRPGAPAGLFGRRAGCALEQEYVVPGIRHGAEQAEKSGRLPPEQGVPATQEMGM